LVPEAELAASYDYAIKRLAAEGHKFGDYLEFGVSRGTSLACMYHSLADAGLDHVRLIGFDSFEGLPPEAAEEGWAPEQFASTMGATQRYLRSRGVELDRVSLVKGWFRETLRPSTTDRLNLGKASLIMIDCDIYSASKQALWYCAPLIQDQAVLIFDDWGWRADKGERGQREALEEFLEAFPSFKHESLPAYIPQARMFHLSREGDGQRGL
jgi:O-methyltransferase